MLRVRSARRSTRVRTADRRPPAAAAESVGSGGAWPFAAAASPGHRSRDPADQSATSAAKTSFSAATRFRKVETGNPDGFQATGSLPRPAHSFTRQWAWPVPVPVFLKSPVVELFSIVSAFRFVLYSSFHSSCCVNIFSKF